MAVDRGTVSPVSFAPLQRYAGSTVIRVIALGNIFVTNLPV
jgi:hypothetical protein